MVFGLAFCVTGEVILCKVLLHVISNFFKPSIKSIKVFSSKEKVFSFSF